MKIIGTNRIGYCDRCGSLKEHCFIVKGLFLKHNWCYNCLIDNSFKISNLRLR